MNVLELESFSVAFAERQVLRNVTLALPQTGMSVLVGPSGGGKSTLLRTLSGANDGHASMHVSGCIKVAGVRYPDLQTVPLEQRPGLVRQNVRFLIDTVRENLVAALPNRASLRRVEQDEIVLAHLSRLGLSALSSQMSSSVADLPIVEQRLLALARVTIVNPLVLLVDEATVSLPDADARLLLAQLRKRAEECSVLFVTHHQGHARAVGGTTYLLNGGSIVASGPTQEFFEAPPLGAARQFVTTGGCVPETNILDDAELTGDAGDTSVASIESSIPPHAESAARGPRHFYWVLRGHLAGLPRPGIFQDVSDDLDALERVKITTLVTLEEWESVPREEVERRGIELIHFPITDMKAPNVEDAARLCAELERRIRNRGVVAVHCRAGNGRTGTLLAAMLIHRQTPACDALERVRSVNPKAVESEAQVRFLETFEKQLLSEREPAPLQST